MYKQDAVEVDIEAKTYIRELKKQHNFKKSSSCSFLAAIGGVMYKVFGLRLGPSFEVRPAADKNVYWRLVVEKIYVFAVFSKKHLQSYGCVATKFTAAVNHAYPKTKICSGTVGIQNR